MRKFILLSVALASFNVAHANSLGDVCTGATGGYKGTATVTEYMNNNYIGTCAYTATGSLQAAPSVALLTLNLTNGHAIQGNIKCTNTTNIPFSGSCNGDTGQLQLNGMGIDLTGAVVNNSLGLSGKNPNNPNTVGISMTKQSH